MHNVTIGWPNRIYQATLSGGQYEATLPRINLKSRETTKLARSFDASPSYSTLDIDLMEPCKIGVLAVLFHNASVAGEIQLLGNDTNSFASPAYDSGDLEVYPSGAVPFGTLEWGDYNFWLGTLSPQAVAGYKAPFTISIPERPNLRYWRLNIKDSTNSDGAIHFRVFIGDTWTAKYNMSYGAGLGHNDLTEVKQSLGGQEYFKKRPRYRNQRFSLNHLTESEFQKVLDMEREAGVSDELFIMPDLSDTGNGFRRNFLARMTQLPFITDDSFGKKSAEFEIKELL